MTFLRQSRMVSSTLFLPLFYPLCFIFSFVREMEFTTVRSAVVTYWSSSPPLWFTSIIGKMVVPAFLQQLINSSFANTSKLLTVQLLMLLSDW